MTPTILAGSGALNRLHWRTRHRTVGAEDAAVTRFRFQQHSAPAAVIEELAGVCRHPLGRLVPATRTGNDRVIDHGITLDG